MSESKDDIAINNKKIYEAWEKRDKTKDKEPYSSPRWNDAPTITRAKKGRELTKEVLEENKQRAKELFGDEFIDEDE